MNDNHTEILSTVANYAKANCEQNHLIFNGGHHLVHM